MSSSIPSFTPEERQIVLQFDAQKMYERLCVRQLRYIWNVVGASIDGMQITPARKKIEYARNIVKFQQLFEPVLRALLPSSQPPSPFDHLPRSNCTDNTLIRLLVHDEELELFGQGLIQSSRTNVDGVFVNVKVTQLEDSFSGYILEYENTPATVGVIIPWNKNDIIDESVYQSILNKDNRVTRFSTVDEILDLRSGTHQESTNVDQISINNGQASINIDQVPSNQRNDSIDWENKYDTLKVKYDTSQEQLNSYRTKSQKLEQYVAHCVHTMLDLSSMYKKIVRNEDIIERQNYGFTLDNKFYEISEEENTTMTRGNQGHILFHILIKHVSEDHLPLLYTKGYCMPGNRKPDDDREKLSENVIKLLTEDAKQFVPFFRTKTRKWLRRSLGETLSEIKQRRKGKSPPTKRARIESESSSQSENIQGS